jgi:hypothetical protein
VEELRRGAGNYVSWDHHIEFDLIFPNQRPPLFLPLSWKHGRGARLWRTCLCRVWVPGWESTQTTRQVLITDHSIAHSDRPKTFSAEYSAETNIRQVLPKTKKVLFSNFQFQSNFFRENEHLFDIVNVLSHYMFLLSINLDNWLQLATASPDIIFVPDFFKFYFKCLLPCAEYSLSAEYSAAFSCRIFVFGQNKKIRFRSITICTCWFSL